MSNLETSTKKKEAEIRQGLQETYPCVSNLDEYMQKTKVATINNNLDAMHTTGEPASAPQNSIIYTAKYFIPEAPMARFFYWADTCVAVGGKNQVTLASLFESYQGWLEETNNGIVLSKRKFSFLLEYYFQFEIRKGFVGILNRGRISYNNVHVKKEKPTEGPLDIDSPKMQPYMAQAQKVPVKV